MRSSLLARPINGPFEDPGVFVDLLHGRRAFLFDLGDLGALSVREALRVRDIFVSHTHMDHFCGFDRLLRLCLGRDMELRLFGPPELIEHVEHKLSAYTWNLIQGYENELSFVVAELHPEGKGRRAVFRLRDGFARSEETEIAFPDGVLFEEGNLRAHAAILDHGIPCLGFALEEKWHVNVYKNRLIELGLEKGPWLRELKALVLAEAPEDTPVIAWWSRGGRRVERELALGELKRMLLDVVRGDRIAYVTDVAYTEANVAAIVALAREAEILFIEATFLDRERERAAARRHLTARQAGTIARLAGAKRVVPFHFSPRYVEEEAALYLELDAAFADDG
ncbi:ribonuclease Z [Benzoatithermus flavus]|uniref:MBL fold metallo-hydrolase n=1 Tax=Benzoatithermus flavus TaxID=3108223 RepID=A0ABU8XPD4_9PROT